ERYTEKARRVIFFARYEASQFGAGSIEPEHILLGLLREDRQLARHFFPGLPGAVESVRKEIEQQVPLQEKVAASVDLPLSPQAKRVLNYADEESKQLRHRNIATDHLLLGILRERESIAAEVLEGHGLMLEQVREELRANFPRGEVADTVARRGHLTESVRRSAGILDALGNDFKGTFPFESGYFNAPNRRIPYPNDTRAHPSQHLT